MQQGKMAGGANVTVTIIGYNSVKHKIREAAMAKHAHICNWHTHTHWESETHSPLTLRHTSNWLQNCNNNNNNSICPQQMLLCVNATNPSTTVPQKNRKRKENKMEKQRHFLFNFYFYSYSYEHCSSFLFVSAPNWRSLCQRVLLGEF